MDDNRDESMYWTDALAPYVEDAEVEARFPLRAANGYGHMWSKPILGRMDAHRRKRVEEYLKNNSDSS